MATTRKPVLKGHRLTIDPNNSMASCECGEVLQGSSFPAMTKNWAVHVAQLALFESMVDAVKREYAAREESELLIMELIAAGVSTAKISEAIGDNSAGKPIMSVTTVQRIARERSENPDKPPRRRRKSNGS